MTEVPGLIETVRVRGGRAPLWALHRERLVRSALALGIPVPAELPEPSGEDRIVRLLVDRHGAARSERPSDPVRSLRLAISSVRHPGYPHKTTDRQAFDEALADAETSGADDAVLLDRSGHVAEAARWTLVWESGGELAAPPLEMGILPSVARRRIESIAGKLAERRVRPEQLTGLPLMAANAARGVVPVRLFAGHGVPESSRFRALAAHFWP